MHNNLDLMEIRSGRTEPLVSIIIPVYNAEKTISSCLDSVCDQTYRNLEIIIINDGSSDGSKEAIESFQKTDSRIVLKSIDNHGVSYARNVGMDISNGEYISFVDSDDLISSDFIQTLVEDIEFYNADLSSVGVVKSSVFVESMFTKGERIVFEEEDALIELFGIYEGFLWNKLYRANYIHEKQLRMRPDIAVMEDLLFNAQYLMDCNRVVFNSGAKYFYRQSERSAIYRLDNYKWFDGLEVYNVIFKMLINHEKAKKKAIAAYGIYICEAKERLKYFEEKDDLKDEITSGWNFVCRNLRILSYKQKAKLILFRLFPELIMMYRRRKLRNNR